MLEKNKNIRYTNRVKMNKKLKKGEDKMNKIAETVETVYIYIYIYQAII